MNYEFFFLMGIDPKRTLQYLSPYIAEEWHPTLNAPLTPKDVFNSSSKKVWWQCKRNKDHEWKGSINDRTRNDRRRSKGVKFVINKLNKFLRKKLNMNSK